MTIEHETHAVPPGRKRVEVTLVIHTYDDVPEDWTDEDIKFRVEENKCVGNYFQHILDDEEAASDRLGLPEGSGVCQACNFTEAYVGHLPFPKRS